MEKKKSVHHNSKNKKMRPKLRFRVGAVVTIFILSFALCFTIFMVMANSDDSFLEREVGTIESVSEDENNEVSQSSKSINENSDESAIPSAGKTNPVPQSELYDDLYLEGCSLVTDVTLAGMKGKAFTEDNLFGGEGINLSNVMTEKQESRFGTLSAYEIIKQKKPSVLYLMFGSELGEESVESMIEKYTNLVNSILSAVPEVDVYVMQYPPVLYDTDTLTNDMVNDYNSRLLTMCNTLGIHCIDTNTPLKSEAGKLDESYWSYETLTLSEKGYDKVKEYILTHVAS